MEVLLNHNGNKTILIGSITGTDNDPQIAKSQKRKLEEAGVFVASSNCDAAQLAVELVQNVN